MDKQRDWLSLEGARTIGTHKPRSSGKDGVCKRWDTPETKTYRKGVALREHEEQPTLPSRSVFGKDIDERSCVFNML